MNTKFPQETFIQTSIRKLAFRQKLFTWFCLAMIILPPVIFFWHTVAETLSFDWEKLGEDRYQERIMDSYKFGIAMLLMIGALVTPLIFFMRKFFNRYREVLHTLSPADLRKAEDLNQYLGLFGSYMPSFMIRGEEVIFFKLAGVDTIRLREIRKLDIKRISAKGGVVYRLLLTLPNGTRNYQMGSSHMQPEILAGAATEVNPNVEITRNDGWI